MLVEAIRFVEFDTVQQQNKFEIMAKFIDANLPHSLGFSMYELVRMFESRDTDYPIAKDKTVDLEVEDDALFFFTIDDWREFYNQDVVRHNLNAETATYAQGAFRQIMVNAVGARTISNNDIAYLKQIEPYITKMANSKPQRIPLLLEPIDVIAAKKAGDLRKKYQEADSIKRNKKHETKEEKTLFAGIIR